MIDAIACGSGKIVDSVLDKGASFAIDLKVRVRVEITEGKELTGDVDPLVEEIARDTLNLFGYDYGLKIEVESEIPPSAGLGNPEAVSAATVTAVAGALAKKHGSVNELRIDKYMKEQFLIINNKVVDKKKLIDLCVKPGLEFDRVSASFYGGFIVSNNRRGEILRRGEMENLSVVLLTLKKEEGIDPDELRLFSNELEIMWDEALKGNLYTAMKLNTLLYKNSVVKEMLKAGSLTASVSFPSVIALVRDEDRIRGVEESVRNKGVVRVTKVCNEKARILGKSKRIFKIKEFLKLKGGDEFQLL
ncbi:MAG: hypothetical protein U9Q22_02565 [Candidatus Altiarchaeota archaeon]|nr:hypothetical protein [Candidatus Altiarchaeota archaeon]